MNEQSVDQLRAQLRELGYLSHGIERWFERDPWRSRAFWRELLVLALKSSVVIAPFVAAAMTVIVALRNHVTSVADAALIFALYGGSALLALFVMTAVAAAALRTRVVERPRIATAAAVVVVGMTVAAFWLWLGAFAERPRQNELLAAIPLLLVYGAAAMTTFPAALLAFSIHSTHRIPHERKRPLWRIVLGVSAGVALVLTAPALVRDRTAVRPPQNVVVTPTGGKLALIAVDGLTHEIAVSRRELLPMFVSVGAAAATPAAPPEAWASLASGTPTEQHGVRAVEGVRLAGSSQLLQSVSAVDVVLREIAPVLGIASREAVPPAVRNRDYVWEIVAGRGVTAVAVNWWASSAEDGPALKSVAQHEVFSEAAERSGARGASAMAHAVDEAAIEQAMSAVSRSPRLVAVYLPALDVLLNRIGLAPAESLAASVAALNRLDETVRSLRAAGYQVLLVGMPGAHRTGRAVIASTFRLARRPALADVAPTVCDFFGFPATAEMEGSSLLPGSMQRRIASYGDRRDARTTAEPSEEYYENLKSLGYVR